MINTPTIANANAKGQVLGKMYCQNQISLRYLSSTKQGTFDVSAFVKVYF